MGIEKIIFLIRLLVLALLLSPADFGLVAIATTATGFFMKLTNFGLIAAAIQADSMDEKKYDATWTFELCRSILVAILTIVLSPLIASIFAEPQAAPVIQVISIRPVIGSLASIKVTHLNRNLAFRPLAILKIVEASTNAIIAISLAKIIGVWAIIFGNIGGATIMVVVSYLLAPYRPKIVLNFKIIKSLMSYGGWLFITGLIAMVGNYGLQVVISRQVGIDGLGLYFLAVQLAFLPNEVVSEVVGSVAFPLFSRLQKNVVQATHVFQALFSSLAALLFPVCALIIVLAPYLPADILGSKWVGTEELIQILSLVVLVGIFGDVAVSVFKGLGQPYLITLLEIVQTSIVIGSVWFLTQRFGLVGAALAWLPAIILSQIICAKFLRDTLHQPFHNIGKPFIAIIVATIAGGVVSAFTKLFISGIIGVVCASIFGILLSGTIILISDRKFDLGFINNLLSLFPQISAFANMTASFKKRISNLI